jgi:hypothetical protein
LYGLGSIPEDSCQLSVADVTTTNASLIIEEDPHISSMTAGLLIVHKRSIKSRFLFIQPAKDCSQTSKTLSPNACLKGKCGKCLLIMNPSPINTVSSCAVSSQKLCQAKKSMWLYIKENS